MSVPMTRERGLGAVLRVDGVGEPAPPRAGRRGVHARLRAQVRRGRGALGARRDAPRPRLRALSGSSHRPPALRAGRARAARVPRGHGARGRLARRLPRGLARHADGEDAVLGRRAVGLRDGVRVRAPAGNRGPEAEVGQEEDEDAGVRRRRRPRRAARRAPSCSGSTSTSTWRSSSLRCSRTPRRSASRGPPSVELERFGCRQATGGGATGYRRSITEPLAQTSAGSAARRRPARRWCRRARRRESGSPSGRSGRPR